MVQSISNNQVINHQSGNQRCEDQSPTKKKEFTYSGLASDSLYRFLLVGILVNPVIGLAFSGAMATGELLDHHGEDIRSGASWLGERVDRVVLGGSEAEMAVKVQEKAIHTLLRENESIQA